MEGERDAAIVGVGVTERLIGEGAVTKELTDADKGLTEEDV